MLVRTPGMDPTHIIPFCGYSLTLATKGVSSALLSKKQAARIMQRPNSKGLGSRGRVPAWKA